MRQISRYLPIFLLLVGAQFASAPASLGAWPGVLGRGIRLRPSSRRKLTFAGPQPHRSITCEMRGESTTAIPSNQAIAL